MNNALSQTVIGIMVILGFFGSFILLLIRPESVHELNREPLMMMIGALISAFAGLMGFFFGSSAGSARKTDLLAQRGNNDLEITK